MVYRVSEEEIQNAQKKYKQSYPVFEPFSLTKDERQKLSAKFCALLTIQNGMDTDDYCVTDANDKVGKYLSDEPEGSRVLILGTGTGREVLSAKEMGFDAVGTTLGSRNVFFGHHYLGLSESELIECANEVLPFGPETFDVVAGFQVFEHAMNPFLFLMEIRRVLKYGGKCVLEWPPAEDFHMDQNPHHQICYCPGQAEALFKKACYADIKLYYSNMQPVPEEDMWSAKNHGHMICIEGIKHRHEQPFVHFYLGV